MREGKLLVNCPQHHTSKNEHSQDTNRGEARRKATLGIPLLPVNYSTNELLGWELMNQSLRQLLKKVQEKFFTVY